MQVLNKMRISIHALHEESDLHALEHGVHSCAISIHALHEESDLSADTPHYCLEISIHALHEESDNVYAESGFVADNFNPRSP